MLTSRLAPGRFLACAIALTLKALFISFISLECLLQNVKLAEDHISASEDGVFLAFVRSDKPKLFRGLQIKYVRGSDPVLKLLDDDGNIAEELSILKWNTDSVEEFLSEKLERL
uniref:Uncharacterized protein n=1 Tax=Sphaerodactylus townsendi TaxID=933632 RepID=A0ACB8F3N4_9SAUR